MLSDNLTSSIGLKAALVSFLKKVLRNSRLLDLSVTFFYFVKGTCCTLHSSIIPTFCELQRLQRSSSLQLTLIYPT